MIRTINNDIQTLLIQAHLPKSFWVEALNNVVPILNLLPSTSINKKKLLFSVLFNKPRSYTHFRVFGSVCYPHTNTTDKLEPRSTPSIFLGYPLLHKGYRCFDLKTRKIIILRYVTFDESVFPYQVTGPQPESEYNFIHTDSEPSPVLREILISLNSHVLDNTPTLPEVEQPVPQPAHILPPPPPNVIPLSHSMVTRSQKGIKKTKTDPFSPRKLCLFSCFFSS